MAEYDLIIRNGTIVDGTGWPASGLSVGKVCRYGLPCPMHVCKAIFCDTISHRYSAAMRRLGDALPPVA
jgi:hypothetical protein